MHTENTKTILLRIATKPELDEEILSWQNIVALSQRYKTGIIQVTLNRSGKSKPMVFEDPWA